MIITRTQIPAEVNNFYNRTLLERAVASFVHTRWAQVKDLPKNAGTNTIKFRRYGNLSASTTPLQEGITPVGTALSVTDITATVAQYGDYVTVSDIVTYESEDAELMIAAELLGEQASDTIDQLTRDVLAACTNVYYSGAGNTSRAEIAAGDIIADANIASVLSFLKNANCKKLTRMIEPSTGYSTVPLAASYVGILHPDITVKAKLLTGWVDVQKYPSQTGVMPNEVGAVGEIRFVETTNAKKSVGAGTGTIDVYDTIIFGANAYGITRVSGEALKNIVKPLGSGGSMDPLDQRATSGWKAIFVAKILNENFITRIVSAKV
jgi:N4-gp56 family major capsid protein